MRSSDTAPRFAVGDKVGPYRIVGRLVGATYHAVHDTTGRRVHLDLAEDAHPAAWGPTAVTMFRALRLGETLAHPGIARVVERGALADRRPWLATEVPSGYGLYDLIVRAPLPAAEVAALIHDLADVLAFAHGRGIIHGALALRSIVPAAAATAEYPVVVSDWGFAAPPGEPDPTRDVTIYDAPERVRGERVDGRADVYALGVIAYRCVAGKFPRRGTNIEVPNAPAGLASLILRMLAAEPAHRPTAVEVRVLAADVLATVEGDAVATAAAAADAARDATPELLPFSDDTERYEDDLPVPHTPRFAKPKWTPAPPLGLTPEAMSPGPLAPGPRSSSP